MKINWTYKDRGNSQERMVEALSDLEGGFHKWIEENCYCDPDTVTLYMVRHNGIELPSTKIELIDAFEQYEMDVKNGLI